MTKKKKVLEGHKKVGSKFVPPMMQIPNWKEISYINQILPEIVWMGLINDLFGYREGIELCSNFATKAYELKETDSHVNLAIASNFNRLTAENKQALVTELEKASELSKYRNALSPLIALYDDFPLAFIGKAEDGPDKSDLVERMKKCIERHIDKYDTPALIIQANVVYIRSSTGGLHIASHIEMPDLNALMKSPDSEEAQRAGSFVRTTAMQEFMPMGEPRIGDWSKSFWNQGYKIDKCDFSWEEDDIDE